MFKLRLFSLLCSIFGFAAQCSIRFIPKDQKRLDNRGRTTKNYETIGEGIRALKEIEDGTSPLKEKENGTFYIAIEGRSHEVGYHSKGYKVGVNPTVPLPFPVSQGVSGPATVRSSPANPSQAEDARAEGAGGGGKVHKSHAGVGAAAESGESVEAGRKVKVDLSQIGVQ